MDRKQETIDLRQRLFIGCLGALAPILANLYVVDLNTVWPNLLPLEALTYVVRLLGLCISGCVIVYLNSDEVRPVKLFQLGIMAPAMITSMLNAAAIANKVPNSPAPAAPAQPGCLFRRRMRSRPALLKARLRSWIAPSRKCRPCRNRC